MLASVPGEVAVVAVDHGQAGAHVAGQIEGGDADTIPLGRDRTLRVVGIVVSNQDEPPVLIVEDVS